MCFLLSFFPESGRKGGGTGRMDGLDRTGQPGVWSFSRASWFLGIEKIGGATTAVAVAGVWFKGRRQGRARQGEARQGIAVCAVLTSAMAQLWRKIKRKGDERQGRGE